MKQQIKQFETNYYFLKDKAMSSIESIYIPLVEPDYDDVYIMTVLYYFNIATVDKVTIIPQEDRYQNVFGIEKKYNKVYIEIFKWHDSETANNFIKRLQSPDKECHLYHMNDNWWSVKINTCYNICYMYDMQKFTTANYLCDDEFYEKKLNNYKHNFMTLYNVFTKQDFSSLMQWYEMDNVQDYHSSLKIQTTLKV
jgi:hypothetical protein